MAQEKETGTVEGQPTGELETKAGQSENVQNADTTAGKGEKESKFERDYKALQREFSKRTDEEKALRERFDKYGGVDKILDSVDYLMNNERFHEFLASEQRRNELGVDDSELDDDTKKALKLVQQVSGKELEKLLGPQMKAFEERINALIDPLASSYGADKVDNLLEALDEKYGDDWQVVANELADMVEGSKINLAKLSFDDMEDFLFKSLRKAGELDGFLKKMYKRELEAKKELATDTPGKVADSEVSKKAGSIKEAYELAKRQHNFTYSG